MGNVLTANERAQQLFDIPSQEFRGCRSRHCCPSRARHTLGIAKLMRAGAVGAADESSAGTPGLGADGSEFIAEIGLTPLNFKTQDCAVANVRDITRRKQLEAERVDTRIVSETCRAVWWKCRRLSVEKLSTELHDRQVPAWLRSRST
jgi:PAS domain S-box-containing protein